MNMKSFLLGAAAILATGAGAQAADAIVAAEPEPAEYVKVCDAFGKGYFYIPGSETCLSIGGYLRNDIRGGTLLGEDTSGDGKGDTWSYRTRFAMRISSATDTEYGALKTFSEVRFNYNDNVNSNSLYISYIDLAGLRIGKDESSFMTFQGKAGGVVLDDIIPYGGYEVQLISYTLDMGNGFSGLLAVEHTNLRNSEYVPNVVSGLKYKGDTFSASIVGAYDDHAEDGAVKARVDGKFGNLQLFAMAGYNTGDVPNFYANWKGDWVVWGGGSYKFNDTMTSNVQLSYDEADQFAAAADIAFKVVSGFVITPEAAYFKKASGDDRWGGVVRFQRNF